MPLFFLSVTTPYKNLQAITFADLKLLEAELQIPAPVHGVIEEYLRYESKVGASLIKREEENTQAITTFSFSLDHQNLYLNYAYVGSLEIYPLAALEFFTDRNPKFKILGSTQLNAQLRDFTISLLVPVRGCLSSVEYCHATFENILFLTSS